MLERRVLVVRQELPVPLAMQAKLVLWVQLGSKVP
jgi:hypothetical protein